LELLPFVAQTTAENAIHILIDQGMKQAKVMISGHGQRRDMAL
jgi:ribosomal protein S11